MTKYEYRLLDISAKDAEKALNDLGAQGWDVGSITDISVSLMRIVLKRPVPTGTIALLGGN
ncbi:MAG: hypothetical protein WCD70_15145 [Alphaproteobacteria bacterium]